MAVLSIIVPAYNAEKYIGVALDSLINQTLQDIEIICVNDGSTDNTLNIINSYAQRDNRIKVLNKKNEGIGLARRDGIYMANTEYVCFLDSDDYYNCHFCEKMLSTIMTYDADIVECGFIEFNVSTEHEHYYFDDNKVLEKKDFIDKVFNNTIVDGTEAVVVWNKLYKRDLIISNINSYSFRALEDYIFNLQYYQAVNRYCYIHEPLMFYRISPNSLSKQFNKDIFSILKNIHLEKNRVMQALNCSNDQYKRAADWFCKYVKGYLLNNAIVFSDLELFNIITCDTLMKQQAQKVSKQTWFTKCINSDSNCLRITFIALVTILYKSIKKIRVLIRR